MNPPKRIAIVGEFDRNFRPHVATNEALEHSRKSIAVNFLAKCVSTLFVPQDNSSFEMPHPLVTNFLKIVTAS